MKPSNPTTKRKLGVREASIIGVLLISMAMATGPGVLLVNRPETLFGFPLIYVWGVAWYVVLGGLAIVADRLVWKKDCDSQEEKEAKPGKPETKG